MYHFLRTYTPALACVSYPPCRMCNTSSQTAKQMMCAVGPLPARRLGSITQGHPLRMMGVTPQGAGSATLAGTVQSGVTHRREACATLTTSCSHGLPSSR
jgi:hypothetical protein